jgi:hypothetical protein
MVVDMVNQLPLRVDKSMLDHHMALVMDKLEQ